VILATVRNPDLLLSARILEQEISGSELVPRHRETG
jgi:hypothetical protein